MEKKTLIGWIIIAVMVLSTFGFVVSDFSSTTNKQPYGKYVFYETGQGWKLKNPAGNFNYHPLDLEDIKITPEDREILLNTRVLVITYDPGHEDAQDMAQAQFYLDQILPQYKDVFVIRGLTNTTNYETVPLFACANATATEPVLLLEHGNKTMITRENDCWHAIAAQQFDYGRLAERIVYELIEVMT